MTNNWETLKVLLTFVGPILLPKMMRCYQSFRSAPSTHHRPITPAVSRTLIMLFTATLCYLILTLPYFWPEEIFSLTQSRLQIPNDVLFTRLSALRPNGLTDNDKILKSKISSLGSRLLYLQYGPSTITGCKFCNPEDPKSYFYFSLPTLLFPHLLNLFILGIATSSMFTGRNGNLWRTRVNLIAIGLAALDIYLVFSYEYRSNSRAKRLEELDLFYWQSRIYRLLALAILDGVFGYILYLSTTRKEFFKSLSVSERLEELSQVLQEAQSKIIAIGVVQNTIVRDKQLSHKSQQYWTNEVQVNREIMEEREVVENITDALENRIDIGTVERDAESYVQKIMVPFFKRAVEGTVT